MCNCTEEHFRQGQDLRYNSDFPSVFTVRLRLLQSCGTQSWGASLFLFTPLFIIHSIRQPFNMHIFVSSHTHSSSDSNPPVQECVTLGVEKGRERKTSCHVQCFPSAPRFPPLEEKKHDGQKMYMFETSAYLDLYVEFLSGLDWRLKK